MTTIIDDSAQLQFGDVKKVAQITGISVSALNKLRCYVPAESPPFLRIGGRVVYPLTGPNGLGRWAEQRLGGAGTVGETL